MGECKGFTVQGPPETVRADMSEPKHAKSKYNVIFKKRFDFVEARGHTSFKFELRAIPDDKANKANNPQRLEIDQILSRLLESELGEMDATRERLTTLYQRVAPDAAAKRESIMANRKSSAGPSNGTVPTDTVPPG